MKKIVILFLFTLSAPQGFSQIIDCSKFRDGKFRTADPRIGAIVVTDRRGMYQTENTEALKLIVRFNISWQDDCNYTLRLDKVVRNENKVDIPSNLQISVKIIETKASSYIEEINSSLNNSSYRTEVFKTD